MNAACSGPIRGEAHGWAELSRRLHQTQSARLARAALCLSAAVGVTPAQGVHCEGRMPERTSMQSTARRASARDGASQSRPSVQIEEPTSGSVFCFKASASPLTRETRHRRGPEKTVCRDTWPSAAQPIPSLPPLCSLLSALCSLSTGDMPRGQPALSR